MKSKVFRVLAIILCAALFCVLLSACNGSSFPNGDKPNGGDMPNGDNSSGGEVVEPDQDDNDVTDIDVPTVSASGYKLVSQNGDDYVFAKSDDESQTVTLTITCESGTASALTVTDDVVTFGTISEKTEFSISGTFYGKIVIDVGDDNKFELALCGLTLTSQTDCPLQILSGDKVTISAKKSTQNYVYDLRESVGDDDTAISSAIYATCDLDVQGKGELYVKSAANNGIHTKDDLTIKNLTLQVSCVDNALKGNDSVTVESGNVTLIATQGDGIKTKNSDVSSKGNRRGNVTISGGTVLIYAACDGIDAAYNAQVDGETDLQIFTAQYSKFTQSQTSTTANGAQTNAVAWGGGRPGGGGGAGGPNGGGGGMPSDGNTDKSDVSSKGIKAANEILISGGTIAITSYDDAIHANADGTFDDGSASTGNVTVSGGTLTLYSRDDAIHADGKASVTGGTISVTYSYEGIEGASVEIGGGKVSVVASDDGINGTSTADYSITISGGELYVYAGGDGLDSNSTTSYKGILFSGGKSVVISYGNGDSSIDTERGYTYTGGTVVAFGGGMSRQESANASNFSSVGVLSTQSVSQNGYLVIDGVVTARVPKAFNNAVLVILGAKNASVSVSTSTSLTTDENGVAWQI